MRRNEAPRKTPICPARLPHVVTHLETHYYDALSSVPMSLSFLVVIQVTIYLMAISAKSCQQRLGAENGISGDMDESVMLRTTKNHWLGKQCSC
eukprot:scaffold268723_cov38-Prasinocladus_malaysianus.AAC.1